MNQYATSPVSPDPVHAERGFTLIEVLISMLIFSIGSLGILGLLTFTLHQNSQSRYGTEASLVGQWMVDQLQVRRSDDDFFGCTQTALNTMCRADGTSKSATAATISLADVGGGAYGSTTRFQLSWAVTDLSGANAGLKGIEVVVLWPRNRNLVGLDAGETGFVSCPDNPEQCHRLNFHSYRSL